MLQDIMSDYSTLFLEVVKHEKWWKVIDNEISSIEKNQTWELRNMQIGAKILK